MQFLKRGGEARNRLKLYRAAKRHVDSLVNETDEAGNLGVQERGQRIVVYKTEVKNAIYDNTPTEEHTNLHWTALGKAILAHLPDEQVDEIIDEYGLPKRTRNTITDREELEAERERIREQGYSVEDEERREDVVSIGVPIQDKDDPEPVYSVSISGPTKRIEEGDEVRPELIDAVKQTAT